METILVDDTVQTVVGFVYRFCEKHYAQFQIAPSKKTELKPADTEYNGIKLTLDEMRPMTDYERQKMGLPADADNPTRIEVTVCEIEIVQSVGGKVEVMCSPSDSFSQSAAFTDAFVKELQDRLSPHPENTMQTPQEDRGANMILQINEPGRKPDANYDEAYEKIRAGLSPAAAFEWFCGKAGILKPDKLVRDAFKAAMKRRQNKT